MTPNQTLTAAAIGGLAALLGLAVFTALAIGVYRLVQRLYDAHDERRTLAAYRRQLNALPTTHPKEH
jgi:hypothetical protein